ncbi:TIR domain-containing protein [Yinghuangia soli]|uniref:TIR domain-containing protein n=1 Tax=Yinghuangia soli TaxID=2908204 RepID=A0AA41PVH5_9ACTN|nr:TIR domain-containing protein [Yinghuangia soli]MCF2526615.1 TIR domain-containing protein [Yinghuangia soli]
MARKVFYSFHYAPDSSRAAMVRNSGIVDGSHSVSDNAWEEVRAGGDPAIQRWIDGQMSGRSATVVLIGSKTAGRRWINYEIEKSWRDGKGVVGIYIHKLENFQGEQSPKGDNPFSRVTTPGGSRLSTFVKTYDSPYQTSKYTYGYIKDNLEKWIEEAVTIRQTYRNY